MGENAFSLGGHGGFSTSELRSLYVACYPLDINRVVICWDVSSSFPCQPDQNLGFTSALVGTIDSLIN